MQILKQNIKAEEVMRMIDARLNSVTNNYNYSSAKDDKITASAMAETKWQLAELKMQFVDILIKQLDENPEQATTN